MAEYEGFCHPVVYSFPQTGFLLNERLKSRFYLTEEKSKEPAGKSLLLWSGDTIEFWVEPKAGSRTLSFYVFAYSSGRIKAALFEEGNATPLDTASSTVANAWERLELSFSGSYSKNYFLKIEAIPLESITEKKREKVYIDNLELE